MSLKSKNKNKHIEFLRDKCRNVSFENCKSISLSDEENFLEDLSIYDIPFSEIFMDKKFQSVALGRAITRLRKTKNMSQGKAAIAADISQSYLSHVEKGNHSISINKLAAFSLAIDTPLKETFNICCEEFEKLHIEITGKGKP